MEQLTPTIVLADKVRTYSVKHRHIVCLQAARSYCTIHLHPKAISNLTEMQCSHSMNFYVKQLTGRFFKIHRAIVVNLDHVAGVQNDGKILFRMNGYPSLYASRRKLPRLLELIKNQPLGRSDIPPSDPLLPPAA